MTKHFRKLRQRTGDDSVIDVHVHVAGTHMPIVYVHVAVHRRSCTFIQGFCCVGPTEEEEQVSAV